METGKISVQTDNIFPIIKKFLYSDHEIFLRELISNAVDATQKLKSLSSKGDISGELGDLTISVEIDPEAKTLTVNDYGIGMTADEVKKYINEVAFSSAEDFLKKHKDNTNIIGHFGLGFYSSFMVADRVEIITKSFKRRKAVHWSCDGSPNYSIGEHDREDRGTSIVLHIDDDSVEFLDEARVLNILSKYCKFLPIPIKFGSEQTPGENDETQTKDRIINNTNPAWTRKPSKLSDEDYQEFYSELYPMSEPPLFWIHLNVDYPFNLTGILYFPKVDSSFDVQRNKIQLYSNQVFVTDDVKEVVPEWLTLLHGVIDSPDIPLNVSRSYLQSDQNVKKINGYISKKVGEKLEKLFKDDRQAFSDKWNDIGLFVKYGMLSDEKFYDRAGKICLVQDTDDNFYTFDEFTEKVKDSQTDKDNNLVWLYTNDDQKQHSFIADARESGYVVLRMNSIVDPHFINFVETKIPNNTFKRVDSETLNQLVPKKDDEEVSLLTEKEEESLKTLYDKALQEDGVNVQLKHLSPGDSPVMITVPEFSRRLNEMSQLSGRGDAMPDIHSLVVNTSHPVAAKILRMKSQEKKSEFIKHLYNIAMLSQNKLKGEALTNFVKRSYELMS